MSVLYVYMYRAIVDKSNTSPDTKATALTMLFPRIQKTNKARWIDCIKLLFEPSMPSVFKLYRDSAH